MRARFGLKAYRTGPPASSAARYFVYSRCDTASASPRGRVANRSWRRDHSCSTHRGGKWRTVEWSSRTREEFLLGPEDHPLAIASRAIVVAQKMPCYNEWASGGSGRDQRRCGTRARSSSVQFKTT
jgi:hypothetical protein